MCQLSHVSTGSKQSSGQITAFSANGSKPKRDKKEVTCYKCFKKGHYRNKCKENLEENQETQENSKAVATVASDAGDLAW